MHIIAPTQRRENHCILLCFTLQQENFVLKPKPSHTSQLRRLLTQHYRSLILQETVTRINARYRLSSYLSLPRYNAVPQQQHHHHPTSTMVLNGFSYSKLTELQVKGARDRSRRQIESSQRTTRREQVQRMWKAALQEQDAGDLSLFREAISDVYENEHPKREISPIMAARLADLCRQEFKSAQHEKALEQLYDGQRESCEYLCQEINACGKEKNQIKEDLEKQVQAMKKDVEAMKRRKAADLRASLEWKKNELLKVRQTILMRIEELEKKDWSQVPEPVLMCSEGAEWVDIDEDYFHTKGPSSGWVVCS
jgi:hypothetical protein